MGLYRSQGTGIVYLRVVLALGGFVFYDCIKQYLN
jgi:hypothetical protein